MRKSTVKNIFVVITVFIMNMNMIRFSAFVKKLTDVNNSSQSIITLSLWLIHHCIHHRAIVKVWFRELQKASENKKLTLMYLANDFIQNSRNIWPKFGKEFGFYMNEALEHISKSGCQEKIKTCLWRVLDIWEERRVYDEIQIIEFRHSLILTPADPVSKMQKRSTRPSSTERTTSETEETHLNYDKEGAESLLKQVEDAITIINKYNGRLCAEVENRKKIMDTLIDFLESQNQLLAHAETRLEEHQDHLQKLYKVQYELKPHIKNLPYFTCLSRRDRRLPPLPSADDLFNSSLNDIN